MKIVQKNYHGLNTNDLFWSNILSSFIFGEEKPMKWDEMIERQGELDDHLQLRLSNMIGFVEIDKRSPKVYFVTNTALEIIEKIEVKKLAYRELDRIKEKEARIILGPNMFIDYHVEGRDVHVFGWWLNLDESSEDYMYQQYIYLSYDTEKGELHKGMENDYHFMDELFRKLIVYLEFTDIELEFLEPRAKNNKSRKEGKIFNDTNKKLTIVDSKWNVMTIRGDGFHVNGHLRFQPYGPRESPRYKLIWIDEYDKKGYTKKLTH